MYLVNYPPKRQPRPGGTGLTVKGQSTATTTLQCPKGTSCALIAGGNQNSNVTIQDISVVGNVADYGTLWAYTGVNKNYPGDYSTPISAGQGGSGALAQRIKCTNAPRCVNLEGGAQQLLNSETVMTVGQRTYFQWQFAMNNCSSHSVMDGITATGTYLLKTAELFNCSTSTMTNVTATNGLFSVNGGASSTLSNITSTITANSFFNVASGWFDEPVISINQNAGGTGTGGTLSSFKIIQQGYVGERTAGIGESLKAIQLTPGQTDWTVSGGYAGALWGVRLQPVAMLRLQTYRNAAALEYGAMAILSDAARTTITGIRSVGTAIGSPGHSLHYGNISLNGANSTATNNVADVVHMGGSSPTTSGNRTNAAYGC
jgi:hypothetical protein